MPLSLTADPVYTLDQVSAPEDGDDLDAAASLAALQLLTDRVAFARTALEASLLWSGDFAVDPSGSLTSFTVRVGSILALALADSASTLRVGAAGATTIGVSKIEGAPGTLGAVARCWYVYAFLTTLGAVDYEISLTAPDASRRIKGGDFTRAYLGCFRTTAAGAPLPGRKAAGRWVYRRSALASNETRVLNVSSTGGPSDLDLSALVPPHARVVTLALQVTGGDNGVVLSIACNGDTSDLSLQARAPQSQTSPLVVGDIEVDASQIVDRTFTLAGTTGTGQAFVHGFYE